MTSNTLTKPLQFKMENSNFVTKGTKLAPFPKYTKGKITKEAHANLIVWKRKNTVMKASFLSAIYTLMLDY